MRIFFKNPNQFFTYQNLHLMLYSSCSKKEYVKGEKAAAQRETSSVLNQKHVIFGGFIESVLGNKRRMYIQKKALRYQRKFPDIKPENVQRVVSF